MKGNNSISKFSSNSTKTSTVIPSNVSVLLQDGVMYNDCHGTVFTDSGPTSHALQPTSGIKVWSCWSEAVSSRSSCFTAYSHRWVWQPQWFFFFSSTGASYRFLSTFASFFMCYLALTQNFLWSSFQPISLLWQKDK